MGAIIRTVAQNATEEVIEKDIERMVNKWQI